LNPWPGLNNNDDELSLLDPNLQMIDRVSYDRKWYKDTKKDDGGYALELIDPDSKCGGHQNWSASKDSSGGTPGSVNSIEPEIDLRPPVLSDAFLTDQRNLILVFDESILPNSLSNLSLKFSDNLSTEAIELVAPGTLQITLKEEVSKNREYFVFIRFLSDCKGNVIIEELKALFVLPEASESMDVVINEILFNPYEGGVDFVELFNRSYKFIDLKDWEFGNYQDSLVNRKWLIRNNYILSPGEYLVITKNINTIKDHYPGSVHSQFIETDLPGMANESGNFALKNSEDLLIDHFIYNEDLHFSILRD